MTEIRPGAGPDRDDPALSALYRTASREQPAPELDARILAAARDAARGRSRRQRFYWRWSTPLATAALLLLGLSLMLRVGQEVQEETAPLQMEAPAPQAPRTERKTAPFPPSAADFAPLPRALFEHAAPPPSLLPRLPAPSARARGSAAETGVSSDEALDEIRALLAAGRADDVRKQLDALLARRPGIALPPDLIPLLDTTEPAVPAVPSPPE